MEGRKEQEDLNEGLGGTGKLSWRVGRNRLYKLEWRIWRNR